MRIGIDLNNVLRDTLKKIEQEYTKWYLNDLIVNENESNSIERKVLSKVDSLDILSHLVFIDENELHDFLYDEHTMEIFGHAPSVENNSIRDLNNIYLDLRDEHDFIIVSNEIGKSKPASLFFISKFGCLLETVKFYSDTTLQSMWDTVDVLLTANPNLLINKPKDKLVIKFNTEYNKQIDTDYQISTINELKEKIKEIYA